MHLKKIIFNNFRQFYGKQSVDLDISQNKNLIVIHAENNVGKTTFLQAFTWCLFEKDTFNTSEYLNDKVKSDLKVQESAEVSVELIFDDRNKEYYVYRAQTVKKIKEGNTSGNFRTENKFIVKIDGKEITSNPKDSINRILNPELSEYFFFEGESIGELSKKEKREEIEKGIKYIMGLEVYDRAIKHVRDAKNELKNELEEIDIAEGESKSPHLKKEEVLKEIEDLKTKISNTQKFKLKKIDEKQKVSEEIKRVESLEKYEKEREKLVNKKNQLLDKKEQLQKDEKKYISQYACFVLLNDIILDTSNFLEEKREKGELPSNIKEQFIQDLLEAKKCICGSNLTLNSNEYNTLKKMLNNTVKKEVEDGFINITAFTKTQINFKTIFQEKINSFFTEKQIVIDEIDQVIQELEEVNLNLKDKAQGSSRELILKREQIDEDISDLDQNFGRLNENLRVSEENLSIIEKEIKNYHSNNRKLQIAEKRLDLAEKLYAKFNEEYELLTNEVRKKLSEKVAEVFESIIHGGYKIKINNNFELEVRKTINNVENETDTSRGQDQIASLSFISSLVYIAKKWDEEQKQDIWRGSGVYPLVIDSPYGTLGKTYRESLTKNLRKLAPQIILMVSSSQWSPEVEENFRDYCKHEYIFVHNHPENMNDEFAEYGDIIIDNNAYSLEKVNDFEFTEIKKVK